MLFYMFSEEKRQTCCSCICKVPDGEKQHELLPVAGEVQHYSFRYSIIYCKPGGQNHVVSASCNHARPLCHYTLKFILNR